MHAFFEMQAKELNKEGVTFSQYIKMRPRLDLKWSPYLVKEIWHECQRLMYGQVSTAELTTEQVNHCYEVVSKAISETTGVDAVPFPSIEFYSLKE